MDIKEEAVLGITGLDDDAEDNTILIKLTFPDRDGTGAKILQLPKDAAVGSLLLKDSMDMDGDFANGTNAFPLDKLRDDDGVEFDIDVAVMQSIIDYLVQHKGEEAKTLPKPLPYDNINELADKWDRKFLSETIGDNTQTIIKYAIISDYLKIAPLCELICAKLGLMLRKCRTVEEIRTLMNIENDFTPEEEKAHAAKWGWIDDINN